jgi:hypothetical protein
MKSLFNEKWWDYDHTSNKKQAHKEQVKTDELINGFCSSAQKKNSNQLKLNHCYSKGLFLTISGDGQKYPKEQQQRRNLCNEHFS